MHQKHQSEAVFTAEWWPLFTRANFLMHCLSLVSCGPGPGRAHLRGPEQWRQRHNWWQLNRINNSQLLYWALWGGMLVQYFIRSPSSWDTSQTLIETRISFFWNVLAHSCHASQYHNITISQHRSHHRAYAKFWHRCCDECTTFYQHYW